MKKVLPVILNVLDVIGTIAKVIKRKKRKTKIVKDGDEVTINDELQD